MAEYLKKLEQSSGCKYTSGPIDERLEILLKRDKFIDKEVDEISPKIVSSLKGLKQETVDSMSDGFLEDLVKNTIMQDKISDNLKYIEREFTPAEIKKITSAKSRYGQGTLHGILVGQYNTPDELNEMIEYAHNLAKKA